MFEHLDDRDGYRPSTTMLAAVTREGRRRRRRTRVAQAGTASVAALALGTGVAVTSFNRKLDSVERVEVGALADDPPAPGEPYTILLVGLDEAQPGFLSTPMGPNGEQGEAPMTQRSDTIALVRILPADERVTILSLPRDLWVDIPGAEPGRINSVVALGGIDLLVETVEANLDLEVDRFASIDFEGARRLGDAVGGLRLDFRYPTRDRSTGFEIRDPGCHTLDGEALLAYVRSRQLETERSPGQWEVDQGYDLSRVARNQDLVTAAIAAFSHVDPADPVAVGRFVDAVTDHVTLDASVDRDAMVQMFRDLAGSELVPAGIPPYRDVTIGGAAVLELERGAPLDLVRHVFLYGEAPDPHPEIDRASLFPPPALQPRPQDVTPC